MKHKLHFKKLTLRKDLNLFQAVMVGVGITIGAGIYVLLGPASALAGNAIWISFIISAVLALFTGLSYAELLTIFPKDGSEYLYIENTFNKKLAFLIGYLILLGGAISAATVALGFAGYLSDLLNYNSLTIIAFLLLVLMAIINLIGLKESSYFNIILTTLEILGLIFVIIFSLKYFGNVNYLKTPFGIRGIFNSASLIFFAFIGFESLVKLSEETKNAKKVIPLALIFSILISTILYILVSLSAVSVLGYEALSQSKAPLSEVILSSLGSKYSFLISIIALLSTATTVLLILLSTSRILYGVGEENKSLKIFTKISKKTRTPYISILAVLFLSLIFVLIGKIEIVASITNFMIFTTFFFVNLSLIILRIKKPNLKRKFKVPLNIRNIPLISVLGLLSSIFFILNLQLKIILSGIFLVFIGLLIGKFAEK